MDDTTQAIATLTAYAASCHDEIAQAGARLVAAYAVQARWAQWWKRAAHLHRRSDFRTRRDWGKTYFRWRDGLRELRDANAQLETQVQAQAEEIARLRTIIAAAVQVSAERGENSSESHSKTV